MGLVIIIIRELTNATKLCLIMKGALLCHGKASSCLITNLCVIPMHNNSFGCRSWADARLHCQQDGGDLVSINSPEEQSFLECGFFYKAFYLT